MKTDRPGDMTKAAACERLVFAGRVQGVGFRPHLARLAAGLGLSGWARNETGTVVALIEGDARARDNFARCAIGEAPPLAAPRLVERSPADGAARSEFTICRSAEGGAAAVFVPPDTAPCAECLAEMKAPDARRYGYPFINCTQCGPRYTIIEAMPYDRANTSMAGFPMCPDCRAEYEAPQDRRFHAEPIACVACGPQIWFAAAADGVPRARDEAALTLAAAALRDGQIVGLRAVGGYQLLCDATKAGAVAELRRRKGRPDKPLAVMVGEAGRDRLDRVRELARVDDGIGAALLGPDRPIVLVPPRAGSGLAPGIAPGCSEVGIMLPSAPLHHLLLDRVQVPVVATSGNVSGDPILTGVAEAAERLAGVADSFLHHDRPILRPADDPVLRRVAGVFVPLRMGRGNAPAELEMPTTVPVPVLAAGAQAKTTIALGFGHRIVVSPHIGDMESLRALERFGDLAESLQRLYAVDAKAIVCDAHPGFSTLRWAEASGLPVEKVLHHHAHASALVGEAVTRNGEWLVFTWDAVGLGERGALWGGECLAGRPGRWRRVATMRPLEVIGGDRAAREPWRSAAAMCWATGRDLPDAPPGSEMARNAWERRINTHATSGMGRVFDAAAFLLVGMRACSFEAQAPMAVEAMAAGHSGRALDLPLRPDKAELLTIDWEPLVPLLTARQHPVGQRAADLHATLAASIAGIVAALRGEMSFRHVGLTGGVFQNARLVRETQAALERVGVAPVLHRRLPCNDASLSFGQVVEYAARAAGEG